MRPPLASVSVTGPLTGLRIFVFVRRAYMTVSVKSVTGPVIGGAGGGEGNEGGGPEPKYATPRGMVRIGKKASTISVPMPPDVGMAIYVVGIRAELSVVINDGYTAGCDVGGQ